MFKRPNLTTLISPTQKSIFTKNPLSPIKNHLMETDHHGQETDYVRNLVVQSTVKVTPD